MNIDDFNESLMPGFQRGNIDPNSKKYINAYWINRAQLQGWANILQSVFYRSSGKVSVFPRYLVEFQRGGLIFEAGEFLRFTSHAKQTGAEHFAVIEDTGQENWANLTEYDFFRFAYPIDISWNELIDSSIIAEDVFTRPIRCFFVVTDNAKHGKYSNNDADIPYDLYFSAINEKAKK